MKIWTFHLMCLTFSDPRRWRARWWTRQWGHAVRAGADRAVQRVRTRNQISPMYSMHASSLFYMWNETCACNAPWCKIPQICWLFGNVRKCSVTNKILNQHLKISKNIKIASLNFWIECDISDIESKLTFAAQQNNSILFNSIFNVLIFILHSYFPKFGSWCICFVIPNVLLLYSLV